MDDDTCVKERQREELIRERGASEEVIRCELDRRVSETPSHYTHI